MKKILMLDDNELLVEQFKYIFEDYLIIDSSSIKQAKTIIESNQNLNLIILDESLPDGKGSSLVPYIREKYPHIGIIILTGWTLSDIPLSPNDENIVIKGKNFKINEIVEMVNELIA
jgi:response regulator of citrate/malate metabolism